MEKTLDPLVCDLRVQLDGQILPVADQGRQIQTILKDVIPSGLRQEVDVQDVTGHDLGYVLDFIALTGQELVKGGIQERVDLERTGAVVSSVDRLTVGDLFLQGDRGQTDLIHGVGAVAVVIGEADEPAIVKLDPVRGPRIQGDFLHVFDICLAFLVHDFPPLPACIIGKMFLTCSCKVASSCRNSAGLRLLRPSTQLKTLASDMLQTDRWPHHIRCLEPFPLSWEILPGV